MIIHGNVQLNAGFFLYFSLLLFLAKHLFGSTIPDVYKSIYSFAYALMKIIWVKAIYLPSLTTLLDISGLYRNNIEHFNF